MIAIIISDRKGTGNDKKERHEGPALCHHIPPPDGWPTTIYHGTTISARVIPGEAETLLFGALAYPRDSPSDMDLI